MSRAIAIYFQIIKFSGRKSSETQRLHWLKRLDRQATPHVNGAGIWNSQKHLIFRQNEIQVDLRSPGLKASLSHQGIREPL